MTVETTGAEALEGGEAIATDVATPESTPEQPATENAAEQPAADGTDEAAATRKKPGVHNRIDELTRQKHDALREAAYWRDKVSESAKTDIDALEYDDQIVAKVRLTDREERADAAERSAHQAVERQFLELESEARGKWADYDAVTRNNTTLPVSNEMASLIQDSELGPDVFYHLGKNPAEAARLASMSGITLAKEMGKLEARITAPKATPKQPPEPVRPVSGIKAGGSKDPNDMSFTEYRAWREANP